MHQFIRASTLLFLLLTGVSAFSGAVTSSASCSECEEKCSASGGVSSCTPADPMADKNGQSFNCTCND
jgi:hypothetical protein